MKKDYVTYAEDIDSGVAQLFTGVPGPMRAYSQLLEEASKPGSLDAKTKELMAVAISVAIRCDGCIAYHIRAAHKKGATRDEVLETIGVAIEMGGGPSVVYGAEALEAYDQHAAPAG
jgi:AhpD family alkylhydroperoxidase